MYDPDFDFDRRLSSELGIANPEAFYPKRKCDEEELKILVHPRHFETIRHALQSKPNRLVDTRGWTLNPYALVTFNVDSRDRDIARSGHSCRVRCALNGNTITSIDMCIKTVNAPGAKAVGTNYRRGEWEVPLPTLNPDMEKMIAEKSDDDPPLPAVFRSEQIRYADLYAESIGVTLRAGYPLYEKLNYKGTKIAIGFHGTNDFANRFFTPHGDVMTGEDSEAEIEFTGIHGINKGDIQENAFEKLMLKSMGLLSRDIRCAVPGLKENPLSKAVRAQRALETVYGPSISGDGISDRFNLDRRIDEAVRFSLSQQVKTTDVSLDTIWMHVGHLNAKMQRMEAPSDNPFAYQKRA